MRYEARITAYDMLDQVCVAAVLLSADDDPSREPEVALRTVVIARGTGEPEPQRWLRDALVQLAETL